MKSIPGCFDEARRYEAFRDEIFPPMIRVAQPNTAAPRQVDELMIQAQWFGGEFGSQFTSVDGQAIEVVQFGFWNRGPGPDFIHAAVRINGSLVRGAVEIDMDARDWEYHGHATNPDFNQVILHVFTDCAAMRRSFTRTSDHREVCQLLLPQFAWSCGKSDYLPVAHPGRCLQPLAGMKDEDVASLLQAAAQFRLKEKSLRLMSMARATSVDQAMFQAVAEAMGYSRNAVNMAVLSQRCPLHELKSQQGQVAESTLFGVAGFLDYSMWETSSQPETRDYVRKLWNEWWKEREQWELNGARHLHWDLAATRPANHPHRRVAALTLLARDWNDLSNFWQQPVNNCEKNVNKWAKHLRHDFWETHYTLASSPSASKLRLLGAERCRDLLGNVIFPGLIAHSGADATGVWEEYRQLRKAQGNQKLSRCQIRLFGDDSARQKLFTTYYHQQQGLLQIYQDFCLEDASDCQTCPFPEQLLQWKTKEPLP